VKIIACSDLHGKLPEIEPCDFLLIAGDICPHFRTKYVGDSDDLSGQEWWLRTDFKEWLDNAPAKHVVAVFGNHDFIGEKRPHMVPKLRWHLLYDSVVEIDGVKFWGSPFQPHFCDWAFNAPPGDEGEIFLAKKWRSIPDDTDIILVHGPPAGYGDVAPDGRPTGSPSLTKRIMEIKPKLSVHGHIHCGRGQWSFNRGNKPAGIIANVSVLNEAYELVHLPMEFSLCE
jgi:Icc-related predicted phosphoesterase